ncbi:MAG TPA: hypothetical protein VFY84_00800 [Jiangellales bacterium]|nr:hypothetical protein [Jiangellales bacterium]
MDLWDVLKLMVRRWYATVPLLVTSLAAAAWIGATSEPDYVATSYVTLLPPTVREDPASGRAVNPWTVDTLMGAVVTRLNSKTEHDRLQAEGHSPTWTAAVDYNFRQQLGLEVTADNAEEASATTQRLQEIAIAEVARQQDGYALRPGEEITAVPFDRGENVETRSKKIYRMMIVVAGAGTILTMGFVIALDALLRWRSNRPAKRTEASDAERHPQRVARVGSSSAPALSVSSTATKPSTPRQADDTVVVRPGPSSGVSSANGADAEMTKRLLRKNGAAGTEYRGTKVEPAPPSGPRAAAEATESIDATIVLPVSNATRAIRDEQKTRRDR